MKLRVDSPGRDLDTKRHENPLHNMQWCLPVVCGLSLLSASAARAQTPLSISYNLTASQRVSINIYNASGALVRELVHGGARAAGARTEQWDGRDDTGAAVPAGSYSWKMLATPGFNTEYITNPGSNYPNYATVSNYNTQGLGSHGGPAAVTTDAATVYMGSGGTEGIEPGLIKLSLDGTTRVGDAGGPGSQALAIGGTTFWDYRNDGIIYRAGASFSGSFNSEGAKDMAANSTNVILCYPTQGLVRWLDNNGVQTRSVSVAGAKTVDVAPDGTVYVITGTTMQKIPVGATSAQAFISTGLAAPRRAAVNPTNGDIYIADCAAYSGGQIKRYSSAGALLQTYGAAGGRGFGLYVNTNFRGITDIAVESNGNFWVAEGESAPRRFARFNIGGTHLNETIGGQVWAPWIVPEPDNPNAVWMNSTYGEMMRCIINPTTKAWSVHSTYGYSGLADGLFTNHGNGTSWEARVRNGELYLCRLGGGPMVIHVDRTNWKLLPAAFGIDSYHHPKPAWAVNLRNGTPGTNTLLWTDANGDGRPLNADGTVQLNEIQLYPNIGTVTSGLASSASDTGDSTLNHLFEVNNKLRRYTVTSWNAAGSPVFSDFPSGTLIGDMPPRPLGDSIYSRTNMTGDSQGNVWAGFNPNAAWGSSSDSFFARWNPNGTLAWMSGRRGYKPGNLMTLRHIFGTINVAANYNVVVAGKFDNEWPSDGVSPLYVYDQDGLYAGQLMGKPTGTLAPNWRYGLGGEALAGVVLKDSGGNVYLYGHWINEGRVYKITGWNGWQRSSGSVTVPAGYTAPASILEVTGPNSNGIGLLGQYWSNYQGGSDPGFLGNPIMTRIDPVLDFNWTGAPIQSAYDLYSVRWTGFLTPRRSGWHMFNPEGNAQVWVNGLLASNVYGVGKAQWLDAGQPYPIKVEFINLNQVKDVHLKWAEPDTNGLWTLIPQTQFSPGAAVPIVHSTQRTTGNQTAYPVSSTDLINAGQATLASRAETGYTGSAGTSPNKLNDGTVGVASDLTTVAHDPDGIWTTTFALNTTTNTGGYDISEINVFSGWTGASANQKFEVLYTTVTNATPVSLGTYEYVLNYTQENQGISSSAKMVISRQTGALARGVNSLIFNFQKPKSYSQTAATVYREIDAFGTPTTPGTGLKGQYYNGDAFNTLTVTRTDPTVNFNWGWAAPPDLSLNADYFSVRWTGQVRPNHSENYTFTTTTDDGVKLWVNNQLLIDELLSGPAIRSASLALQAAQQYDIKMEYREAHSSAYAKLEWQSPSQAKEVIPQSALYPAP